MKIPKLKPCPFCGNKDVSVVNGDVYYGKRSTYVYCYKCGTRGPMGYNGDAVTKWNRRAEGNDDE